MLRLYLICTFILGHTGCGVATPVRTCAPLSSQVEYQYLKMYTEDDDADNSVSIPPERYSEMWIRKMTSFFVYFDKDFDMEVTKEEFVDAVVDRICQYMDRGIADIFAPMWTYTWQRFWYNGGPRGRSTVNEMLESHRYALSSRLFVHSATTWFRVAFDTVLARGKEAISLDEYSLFLKCLDVHPLSAKFAFHSLDANHDNLISKEEFINGGRLFFTASNSTVGDHFWGPMLA